MVYDTDLRDRLGGRRYKQESSSCSLQSKFRLPTTPFLQHLQPTHPPCPSPLLRPSTSSRRSCVSGPLQTSQGTPHLTDRVPIPQINGDRPAIFDFWATWCGPCKIISPVFEKIADQTSGADFYKVDVDEAQDIAQEVGVRAVRSNANPFR